VSTSVGNTVYLLKGAGDGTFAAPVTVADCCFPVHLAGADLNQNGRPDLVACDYNSGVVGVFLDGCTLDPRAPVITRIRDVPNDQGGKVFITWTASSLDVPGGALTDSVVRRLGPPGLTTPGPALRSPATAGAAARAAAAPAFRTERVTQPDGSTQILYWEPLATLPAHRFPGYGFTAPTPQDSLP